MGWLFTITGTILTSVAVFKLGQGPEGLECLSVDCTSAEAYDWDFPIPIEFSVIVGVILLLVGLGILWGTRLIQSGPTSTTMKSLFMPGDTNVFQMVKAAKKMADMGGITVTHGPVTSFGMDMSGSSLQLQGDTYDGQATIVDATPAGLQFGGVAMYVLTLQVTAQDGSTHQATTVSMVPADAVGRVQNGMSVPVKISRANPMAVQVDLGADAGTSFGAGFTPT